MFAFRAKAEPFARNRFRGRYWGKADIAAPGRIAEKYSLNAFRGCRNIAPHCCGASVRLWPLADITVSLPMSANDPKRTSALRRRCRYDPKRTCEAFQRSHLER